MPHVLTVSPPGLRSQAFNLLETLSLHIWNGGKDPCPYAALRVLKKASPGRCMLDTRVNLFKQIPFEVPSPGVRCLL